MKVQELQNQNKYVILNTINLYSELCFLCEV